MGQPLGFDEAGDYSRTRTGDGVMNPEHPASVWVATAHPAPALSKLDRDLGTDVAVIGAGFTGLSAAHHLASAGQDCVVLEANDVGWGASGRTGGILVPRYKGGYAKLARIYGTPVTRHLHRILFEAIDVVEAMVSEHAIDCGFSRCGYLAPAHTARALDMLRADVEWLQAEAGDGIPRLLDGEEAHAELGTGLYQGAYLDVRGGALHPLDFTRGLARSLHGRGIPIFVETPVTRVAEERDGVVVETAGGTVRARLAIIATNAYTAMALRPEDLHRRIVPVSSAVIATKPLSENVAASVLPRGRVASDTKHLLNYFRLLPGRQLIYGGRGDITGRRDDPDVYRGLEQGLARTFPQVPPDDIGYRWSGMVAFTRDDFPHIGKLSDRVLFALGYGGRGVALANLLGRDLARMALGEAVDAGPMSENPFRPFPLYQFRIPGMRVATAYYRMRDMLGI